MDGSVVTVAWDHLVDSLAESAVSPLAVRLGLAQGAALYGAQVSPLRSEREFREWILSLFDAQAGQHLVARASDLQGARIDKQDNPIDYLPVDTEIYNRMIYSTTEKGIWKASVGKGTKHPISTRVTKMEDLAAVSIRARGNKLALAATGEGLFQLGTGEEEWHQEIEQISNRHCEKADWVFQSIFASSTLTGGYLVSRYWGRNGDALDWQRGGEAPEEDGPRSGGTFDDTAIEGALTQPDVSWAHSEKIYTAGNGRLTATRYTQNKIENGIASASVGLGRVDLEHANERATAGGAAVFGTVVELAGGIVVVESDETQFRIEGPVTRWKTYPRAMNYENHLHVILEDRLEVFAFYRDYFVDQREKRFGIEYQADASYRFRRWNTAT